MTNRKPFRDAWWGREAGETDDTRLTPSTAPADARPPWDSQPQLVRSDRSELAADIRARRTAFTPDWRPPKSGDAGDALIALFSEQAEAIAGAVDRLPEKLFVELLSTAGVSPSPPTPAVAVLQFTIADGATESVQIPAGFQVAARPAGGGGDLVVFETERALDAAPGKVAELHVQTGGLFQAVTATSDAPALPFGRDGKVGRALWIGIAGDVAPTRTLSIGIDVVPPSGDPPAVPSGGVAPLPAGPQALLAWDIFDGGALVPAEVVEDQTGNLARGGIVTLRLPATWSPKRPDGMMGTAPLRFLRVRLVAGGFTDVPAVSSVQINVVAASAARSIFDEVLTATPETSGRIFRLSQVPVLAGSVQLFVDEGGPVPMEWSEVDDLAQHGPSDRVFTLDPTSGAITTGDGEHGALVPPGFRNVVAARYRVGGGSAGAVGANAITILLRSVPFVLSATNLAPATGGTPGETRGETLRRGPEEIRARGRAVTLADYELLALRATGAQVARVHAMSGLHPGLPGRPIPGVVGLLIVPPDRGQGKLISSEQELRAVADYMTAAVAPAGATIVVGVPHYHSIRFEARIGVDPAVDSSAAVDQTLQALDAYVHPLTGGDEGTGWPFGGALRYASLVRRLLTSVRVGGRLALLAVPQLAFVVDGLRVKACQDATLPAHALFWPSRHDVLVVPRGAS